MTTKDDKILKELKEISFLLGDLNAIRNGEYDPPRGSGSTGRAIGSQATPNDLIGLIADTNELLGEALSELRLIREATYGLTSDESNVRFDEPKHGDFGAIAESASQIENYLAGIVKVLERP